MTWNAAPPPPPAPFGALGWALVLVRGFALGTLVFGGLVVLLALRLVEWPLCGLRRPVTPHITRGVCRLAFVVLGMGYVRVGQPMVGRGAVVANHASWLDIFALNAADTVYFVAKSEVAGWPGIGWLARATGTLFIRRARIEAAQHRDMFHDRLVAGHRLVFFPEGTSTDGSRILPFKTTLFEAFFKGDMKNAMQLQAVTIIYSDPKGAARGHYGWWGDMGFATHLLKTLATPRQGKVTLIYHPPVAVSQVKDRKVLAQMLWAQTNEALESVLNQ